MKRNITLLLVFLAITGLTLSSCSQKEEQNVITVSIIPQKYFVELLAGNNYAINVMIPPGASPASYEPSPKQMKDLDASGIYLAVGHLGFEKAWLPRLEKNHPKLKIIDTSSGIPLITEEHQDGEVHEDGHHHHGTDPHIWMSPKQAKQMVHNLASGLILHDNACKDLIIQNRDSLLTVLDTMDSLFTVSLEQLENKKFIIFHPALTYLARDYGLEQISMEFEGKEPSPAHLKKIVDRARAENIRVLFIQKEFDVENATQLAKEIDGQLIRIDPLAANWEEQMWDILNKLKTLDAGQTE